MALTTRRRALTTLGAAARGRARPARRRAAAAADAKHRPRPLWRAHAHNDYEHPRPLLDALDHRFGSVEADIFLVGDQLLVAHDPADLDPTRTLESLYLDPLAARVRANHGSVYRGYREPLQLLVDIKTEGSVDVPRTRPPSAPLPAPVHDVRARPGPPRPGHRRDLRRPRRPCAHGGPDRAARLLRRPARRPRHARRPPPSSR